MNLPVALCVASAAACPTVWLRASFSVELNCNPCAFRRLPLYTTGRYVEGLGQLFPLTWTEQSLPRSGCAHGSSAQPGTLEPVLTLTQRDTECLRDLPRLLNISVASSLTSAPWRVKWGTIHGKLVTFRQTAGLQPGQPRDSLASRCLARSLGK